jgi:hypothetical protein
MKKVGIFLIVLALAAGAGIGVGTIIKNRNKNAAPQESDHKNEFVWGVQGGAYALNRLNDSYRPENVEKQLKYIKELGVNLVRANLEMNETLSPFAISYPEAQNDDYINKLVSQKVDVLLVLDPDIPKTVGKANYEEEGYKLGSYAAKRYKGKVKYYQIANEVTGTIVKPAGDNGKSFNGNYGVQYSQARYDAVLGWVKGMSRGIRENDPDAKIVLCGHWILYDVIQKLISDGADFDILGWSWYSADGDDVTAREYNWGDHMNLAEKLYSIKKDVWIVETDYDHGSFGDGKISSAEGERKQAEFIGKFADNVYNSGYFKGFIVFGLFDNPVNAEIDAEREAHWGLVEAKKINGDIQVTKEKPAFNTYKKFISTHLTLPALKAQ